MKKLQEIINFKQQIQKFVRSKSEVQGVKVDMTLENKRLVDFLNQLAYIRVKGLNSSK